MIVGVCSLQVDTAINCNREDLLRRHPHRSRVDIAFLQEMELLKIESYRVLRREVAVRCRGLGVWCFKGVWRGLLVGASQQARQGR